MEGDAKLDRKIKGMDQNEQLLELQKLIDQEESEMSNIRKKTTDQRAVCMGLLQKLQTCQITNLLAEKKKELPDAAIEEIHEIIDTIMLTSKDAKLEEAKEQSDLLLKAQNTEEELKKHRAAA